MYVVCKAWKIFKLQGNDLWPFLQEIAEEGNQAMNIVKRLSQNTPFFKELDGEAVHPKKKLLRNII